MRNRQDRFRASTFPSGSEINKTKLMQPLLAGIVGLFKGVIGFALSAAILIFWLWMLIDCIKYETDSTQRIIWALIIFFLPCVGSLVYFFVRKMPRGS